MITRKSVEISRTEVLINPLPQIKRKECFSKQICPGEFRVITYSGGHRVDGRHRGGWLIPLAYPSTESLFSSAWLEAFLFCSFWKQVSLPSSLPHFIWCPVHFPLTSVMGISLYNSNTCVFSQIELCEVPHCSLGNSCISAIMWLLIQRRKGELCWEHLTRQRQHVPKSDKSILQLFTRSSLENGINLNTTSNFICKEAINIWSNL